MQFIESPMPGNKTKKTMVMTSATEVQDWERVYYSLPRMTHRPAIKWGIHKPQNAPVMRTIEMFDEEVPLTDLQKISENFTKLKIDSLRWLKERHNLEIVAPKNRGPNEQRKTHDEEQRQLIIDALRSYVETKAGQAHGKANAPPMEMDAPSTDLDEMTDAELEEGIVFAGKTLPSNWNKLDIGKKREAYKALVKPVLATA